MLLRGSTTLIGHAVTSLPNTSLWLSVVRWGEGESLVITSPDHLTDLSGCFVGGAFHRYLEGSQTTQRLTTAGLPQLALVHALGILREFQKDMQRIIGSNWWEVWSVNWSLKSQNSTILKTRRQGNVIDFSGIPWGLWGLFRKGSIKKGSCTLTKKDKTLQAKSWFFFHFNQAFSNWET